MAGFEKTAGSKRKTNDGPISMPTDRTIAANSGTVVEDEIGRLTDRQLRELLRLHYEDPKTWFAATLAKRYQAKEATIVNILKYCGPPKIIQPKTNVDYPLGIWHN